MSDYKIISIDRYSDIFEIKNILTKKKILMLFKTFNTFNTESLDSLNKQLQFYKAMKQLDLLNIDIIDYYSIDRNEFEKKYIISDEIQQEYEYKQYPENDNKCLIIIHNYKKVEKESYRNQNPLNEQELFEVYYNLLNLKYNYYINIDKFQFSRYKNIKSINYLICDQLFNSTIPYKILFNFSNFEKIKFDKIIDNQFYENIKDISTIEIFKNIVLLSIYPINETYQYISKNPNKPAIDTLLELAKKLFPNSKKITDIEKKEEKLVITSELSCNESKSLDLTTYIPPQEAYHKREKRYPRFIETGRPISYMIQMCKKIEQDEKAICFTNNLFLPVIRYQGIYHPETEKKNYCGTFFYVEPESTVLLNLGRCAVFSTKIHACIAFEAVKYKKTREEILNDILNLNNKDISSNKDIWLETLLQLKKNGNILNPLFIQTLKESMIQFYIPLLHNESDVKQIPLIETTALYPTDPAKYWRSSTSQDEKPVEIYLGIHDFLDQPMCKMARELKIDTVIFQHEIGETRAVTEILDVRENTYDNLVRINKKLNKPWYKISKKYPTIWFLDDGFITNMKCKKIDIDRDDLNIVKCE